MWGLCIAINNYGGRENTLKNNHFTISDEAKLDVITEEFDKMSKFHEAKAAFIYKAYKNYIRVGFSQKESFELVKFDMESFR